MKFKELELSPELLKSVERAGFEEATPIQSETIPLALAGKDVIGQAQTGTGKTAAFGLPMLEKIDPDRHELQGLVIAPTRELAIQTQEELYRLGRDKKVRVQAVYGGADIGRQIRGLKDRPHIVVGTPGRMLDQYYVRAKEYEKFDIMTRLFDVQTPELTIVFGRTKRRVDELARGLEARGYRAEGIHGDLSQQKRMSVLRSFKSGHLDILVATDVAARGLDISGVTHVYNYDIPQDPESYVHRIGRTGRAGKGGMSVTFVTPNEMDYLHVIENLTKKRMTTLRPPTEKEAFKGQLGAAVEQIETKLAENGLDKYLQTADKLLEEYSAQDLVALLLKTTAKDPADAVPVKITPERPLPMQKKGYNKNGKRGGGNNRNRRDGGNYRGNKSKGGYSKNNNSQKDGGKRHNDKKRGFVIRSNND